MWKSDSEDKEARTIPAGPDPDKATLLGSAIEFQGEISGDADIVMEGKFKGKIDIKEHSLLVEKEAEIDAEVRARHVTVRGKLKGNIFASGKVFIEKEGRMTGDISAARISIMEGARFKGSMKMVSHIIS